MNLQKDWLDYVNRLQERERQKIVSGGLTNWVLALAILGLGYWIYPDITNIQKHWLTVLIGFTIFSNTAITIFDIFNNLYRQEKIKKYYAPTSEVDIKGIAILKVYDRTFNFFSFILNISFAIFSYQQGIIIFLIYFLIYSFRFFYDLLFDFNLIINRVSEKNTHKKLYLQYIEFLSDFPNRKNFKTINNFLKMTLTLTIFSYVFVYYDFNNILWKQIFDGLALVIITILSQFLLIIFIKRMKIAWLENLEKEIILNRLSSEQIVEKLKSGYFETSNIDNYF